MFTHQKIVMPGIAVAYNARANSWPVRSDSFGAYAIQSFSANNLLV